VFASTLTEIPRSGFHQDRFRRGRLGRKGRLSIKDDVDSRRRAAPQQGDGQRIERSDRQSPDGVRITGADIGSGHKARLSRARVYRRYPGQVRPVRENLNSAATASFEPDANAAQTALEQRTSPDHAVTISAAGGA